MRQRSLTFILTACTVLCFLSACDTREELPGAEVPEGTCIDHDQDGYGVACENGLDCDDFDDTVAGDCVTDSPCALPHAGCPCSESGERIECHTSHPVESEDGASLCYAGLRTCDAGVWTTCQGMTSYSPSGYPETASGSDSGTARQAVLGHPRPCIASCDSGCHYIHDCVSGQDLEDPEITIVNLEYDLERTFGVDPDTETFPAALRITPYDVHDIDGDGDTTENNNEGYYLRTLGATCPDDQMAEWWAITFEPCVDSNHNGVCEDDEQPLYFPEPYVGQTIEIDVRMADNPAQFVPGLPWINVVSCPDGRCSPPQRPHDRQFVDDGNLYNTLGPLEAMRQWLQMRVRLARPVADVPSPRMGTVETFFFCGEAS